jgi:hypothetical protein
VGFPHHPIVLARLITRSAGRKRQGFALRPAVSNAAWATVSRNPGTSIGICLVSTGIGIIDTAFACCRHTRIKGAIPGVIGANVTVIAGITLGSASGKAERREQRYGQQYSFHLSVSSFLLRFGNGKATVPELHWPWARSVASLQELANRIAVIAAVDVLLSLIIYPLAAGYLRHRERFAATLAINER